MSPKDNEGFNSDTRFNFSWRKLARVISVRDVTGEPELITDALANVTMNPTEIYTRVQNARKDTLKQIQAQQSGLVEYFFEIIPQGQLELSTTAIAHTPFDSESTRIELIYQDDGDILYYIRSAIRLQPDIAQFIPYKHPKELELMYASLYAQLQAFLPAYKLELNLPSSPMSTGSIKIFPQGKTIPFACTLVINKFGNQSPIRKKVSLEIPARAGDKNTVRYFLGDVQLTLSSPDKTGSHISLGTLDEFETHMAFYQTVYEAVLTALALFYKKSAPTEPIVIPTQ